MLKNVEYPLFLQSAVAIVGFLLVLCFFSWAMAPKAVVPTPAIATVEQSIK